MSSAIAEFYRDRSVFITGGTGFMGKVLTEKLIRSCPSINRVYLLVRASKTEDVNTRLQKMIQNSLFDVVRKENPDALNKLKALQGDVTLDGFGLSPSDLQCIIDEVSVIFNSAATVRFDEDIKLAIELNAKGPLRLMQICRQMKKLESVVHVSTAYNTTDLKVIEEKVYPPVNDIDPHKVIAFIDALSTEAANPFTEAFIANCPNTYTYTKKMAERLLEEERGDIPMAIVRPSIVTSTQKEPIPGWIDNMFGLTGVLASMGKGVLRTFRNNPDMVIDLIPVDVSINLMIAVAWDTAVRHKKGVNNKMEIYASVSSHHNPITWRQAMDASIKSWEKNPSQEMVWYPSQHSATNPFSYAISKALFHYLPAFFLDVISFLTCRRRRWIRVYQKVHEIYLSLEYFMTNEWKFLSNNPLRLLERMSEHDRRLFYFDVRQIQWEPYMEDYILGTRKFIFKQDPKTIPSSRQRLQRLFMVRTVLRVILLTLFGLFLSYIWQCCKF